MSSKYRPLRATRPHAPRRARSREHAEGWTALHHARLLGAVSVGVLRMALLTTALALLVFHAQFDGLMRREKAFQGRWLLATLAVYVAATAAILVRMVVRVRRLADAPNQQPAGMHLSPVEVAAMAQ